MRPIHILLLTALLLAACTDPTAPGVDLLDVSVTLSKVDIALGEETEFRALVANRTARDIAFATNTCVIVFEILDADGRRFVEPVVCNDIEVQHLLRPGESLQRNVIFDGTNWIAADANPGPGPGDYTVRAGVSLALRNPSSPVGLRIRPGTS